MVEQFARWIRRGEMVCYRTGYDFKRGFSKIRSPWRSSSGTWIRWPRWSPPASVYRAAKSEYLLWRPVKGNSHIELTMGHDIRQICYDIKNLIEYARTHRTRSPGAASVALKTLRGGWKVGGGGPRATFETQCVRIEGSRR